MKSFLQYLREAPTPPDAYSDDLAWSDPAEYGDAHYADWCSRNPEHPDCTLHHEKLKRLAAANAADLEERPGAAGEAAHTKLHQAISGILRDSK